MDSISGFWHVPASSSHRLLYFHLALFCTATLVLLRDAPREALYLHAGLWTGMALVAVQALKLGVTVPPRLSCLHG